MTREREERPTGLPQALADAVGILTGESSSSRRFLGGLIAGALVGAAVAGASLVRSRAVGPPEPVSKPKQ
jgi:hypothetical protein